LVESSFPECAGLSQNFRDTDTGCRDPNQEVWVYDFALARAKTGFSFTLF
jgi:hypothetical protein